MKTSIELPEKVSDFFYLIEKEKLDDEAYMLPYFRGGLFNFADEAVFAWDDDGRPLSFAIITMKYKGEDNPTVLGTYTLPNQRGNGYGTQVLVTAIRRLLDRGAQQVLVEFKTDAGKQSFEKLPPELQSRCMTVDIRHLQ